MKKHQLIGINIKKKNTNLQEPKKYLSHNSIIKANCSFPNIPTLQ